jgi:hypothetical protein
LPLNLARRLKGELFCSVEHSELRHQQLSRTAFERIMNLQGIPAPTETATDTPMPSQTHSLIRLWIFIVAGAIALAVLWLFFFSPASSKNHSSAAAAVKTPAPVAATPAEPTRVESSVSVQAAGPSWVVACADGKLEFAKLFTAGSRDKFDFTREAIVRAGNSAALQIGVNGQPIHTPEPAAGVRVIELTADSARFRKGGEPDDCTAGH